VLRVGRWCCEWDAGAANGTLVLRVCIVCKLVEEPVVEIILSARQPECGAWMSILVCGEKNGGRHGDGDEEGDEDEKEDGDGRIGVGMGCVGRAAGWRRAWVCGMDVEDEWAYSLSGVGTRAGSLGIWVICVKAYDVLPVGPCVAAGCTACSLMGRVVNFWAGPLGGRGGMGKLGSGWENLVSIATRTKRLFTAPGWGKGQASVGRLDMMGWWGGRGEGVGGFSAHVGDTYRLFGVELRLAR